MSINLLLTVMTIALCLSSCDSSTATNPNQPANSSKQANAAFATAFSSPTPPNGSQQNAEQKKQVATSRTADSSETLDCTKKATGSNKTFKLPARLCFNDKLPVDKSEVLPDRIKPTDNRNIYAEKDVEYDRLPAEARETIELTVGERYKNSKFHLTIIRQIDFVGNRSVKIYDYIPLDLESTDGLNHWTFGRQGGKLRLLELEIRN